jgi:hypothetical protein
MQTQWRIDDLERHKDTGLVFVAHWRVNAVDGEHTAGAYGSVGFTRGDDFTPFDELTEAQVLTWVKSQLEVEQIEAALAQIIAEQKTPSKVSGLPWTSEVSDA